VLPVFLPFRGKTYKACCGWRTGTIGCLHRTSSCAFSPTTPAKAGGWPMQASPNERRRMPPRPSSRSLTSVDFAGLPGDEVYEADGPVGGDLKAFHLVSEWRREIEPAQGHRAEQIVRASAHFPGNRQPDARPAPGLATWKPRNGPRPARAGIVVGARRLVSARLQRAWWARAPPSWSTVDEGEVVRQRDFQFRAG